MAELAASAAISMALALKSQFDKMCEADSTAKSLYGLVRNVAYTLQDALNRKVFASPSSNTLLNIEIVHSRLAELNQWISNYMQAGKTKGILRRLRDYFLAGGNLDELNRLSVELDGAMRCLGLALNMETCAGVQRLIQRQSTVAQHVFHIVQQHSGKSDDPHLAEKIAKLTNMAISDVKKELAENMQLFRRVDDNVQDIKSMLQKLILRVESNKKQERDSMEPEDLQGCLELAPFGNLEWVERGGCLVCRAS
jgi:hypothetical protein